MTICIKVPNFRKWQRKVNNRKAILLDVNFYSDKDVERLMAKDSEAVHCFLCILMNTDYETQSWSVEGYEIRSEFMRTLSISGNRFDWALKLNRIAEVGLIEFEAENELPKMKNPNSTRKEKTDAEPPVIVQEAPKTKAAPKTPKAIQTKLVDPDADQAKEIAAYLWEKVRQDPQVKESLKKDKTRNNFMGEVARAKALLKSGYSPEDLKGAVDFFHSHHFWADKIIGLNDLGKHIQKNYLIPRSKQAGQPLKTGPDYPKDAAGRYTNHIGHGIFPGRDLSLPFDSLDLNCKADRMAARGLLQGDPEETLQQVEADEEARRFLAEYGKRFPSAIRNNDWNKAYERAQQLCQK